MNSPASSSESVGFLLLDSRIQRWIWAEKWTTLRDAQEQAIPALIDADRDVLIAAPTAEGKTEAAFFPILTHLLRQQPTMGCVLYISPLKALINDQWSRLTALCESLDLPVIGWHGDISASKKHQFLKNPQGILLITPESLEALFVTRGTQLPGMFAHLQYAVVDELHAFIGEERGMQLQSLLHRVETVAERTIPRVGLSATLGDMSLAAAFLRPQNASAVHLIVSRGSEQVLKLQLKGYVRASRAELLPDSATQEAETPLQDCQRAIAEHLYQKLRNTHNLIYPNSRGLVESYADLLRRLCERNGQPNVFWPHHGNLSKELREETERALKDASRPANAVCTTTLELGIDIGLAESVAQIGPPPSVASLRQRLGRSGRRKGAPAILRCYNIEPQLESQSGFSNRIREGLVQSIAIIRLLLAGWLEPPRTGGLHASTLVQQMMSLIAERGGCTAARLWDTLVAKGPFGNIAQNDFTMLLRHLGTQGLIIQDPSQLLLLGERGERMVNHYSFYSAFATDEEYTLVCNGKALGSLPLSKPLTLEQGLIFAGRRWRVQEVDTAAKRIIVVPDKGGSPPAFEGSGVLVHDRVRQEMRAVLAEAEPVTFLDDTAQQLLQEARGYFQSANLHDQFLLESGNATLLLTWCGDRVNNTLALMLKAHGVSVMNEGVALAMPGVQAAQLQVLLRTLKAEGLPSATELVAGVKNLAREKWDWTLPEPVLVKTYSSSCLEPAAAMHALENWC